jgi:AcrR family transcriptional regulator
MPQRISLTGESVAARALEMIDRIGVNGLSMRKLATALGVAPMTIYTYFRDREALLDGVAQVIYGEIEAPSGSETAPRDTLARIMLSVRDVLLRHPNAISLIASRPPRTLDALAFVEASYRALRRAGVDAPDTARAYRALVAYSLGASLTEAGRQLAKHAANEPTAERPTARAMARHLPHVMEAQPYLMEIDDAAEFRYGLEMALDSVLTRNREHGGTRPDPA